MEVNKALISNLEKLARLKLSDGEREKLQADLGKMLDMVDLLRKLPTEGVAPLVYLNEQQNVFRADVPNEAIEAATALQNAPEHDGRFFKVPKVIE